MVYFGLDSSNLPRNATPTHPTCRHQLPLPAESNDATGVTRS